MRPITTTSMSTTARSTATSSGFAVNSVNSIPSSTLSKRCMAPVTDSPRSDDGDLALRWSGRVSLTPRILAVNIFALALLAGGFFYLDSYRSRIEDSRVAQAAREVRPVAEALADAEPERRDRLLPRLARDTGPRIPLSEERKRVVSGKTVSVSVALGGRPN